MNTFSGVAMLVISLVLLGLALHGVSIDLFVLIMASLILAVMFAGLTMAKREYELEDISEKAPEKPEGRRLKADIKPYLTLQLSFLGFYLILTALLWNKLPEKLATHFTTSGPDSYGDKLWGVLMIPVLAWLLSFFLTLPARDPGFFARANFYPKSPRSWCLFTTLVSLGLFSSSHLPCSTTLELHR